MMYLNEDFEGGTTDFQFGPAIAPRRGILSPQEAPGARICVIAPLA